MTRGMASMGAFQWASLVEYPPYCNTHPQTGAGRPVFAATAALRAPVCDAGRQGDWRAWMCVAGTLQAGQNAPGLVRVVR